jgi:hypothetical protein
MTPAAAAMGEATVTDAGDALRHQFDWGDRIGKSRSSMMLKL